LVLQSEKKRIRGFEQKLAAFYAEVDAKASVLEKIHQKRLNCRKGCFSCCSDDITVFEIEAINIRMKFNRLLSDERPHRKGFCALLDEEGGCRIYEQRPYVCRTQGLPLSWWEENQEGQIYRMRDICPLNITGPPIESLPEKSCWSIGPHEQKLAMLQKKYGSREQKRVTLRSLFK